MARESTSFEGKDKKGYKIHKQSMPISSLSALIFRAEEVHTQRPPQ